MSKYPITVSSWTLGDQCKFEDRVIAAKKAGYDGIGLRAETYVDALAEAIVKLYRKPEIRKKMGKAGRAYVRENYELNDCFAKVEEMFYEWIEK